MKQQYTVTAKMMDGHGSAFMTKVDASSEAEAIVKAHNSDTEGWELRDIKAIPVSDEIADLKNKYYQIKEKIYYVGVFSAVVGYVLGLLLGGN